MTMTAGTKISQKDFEELWKLPYGEVKGVLKEYFSTGLFPWSEKDKEFFTVSKITIQVPFSVERIGENLTLESHMKVVEFANKLTSLGYIVEPYMKNTYEKKVWEKGKYVYPPYTIEVTNEIF